jgi:hypothetical protein
MFQVENMGQSKIEKALDVVAKSIEDGSLVDLIKGGKPAALGEIREFGGQGKKYQKTIKGWRPVGKNGPKKQDEIEGDKKKELNTIGKLIPAELTRRELSQSTEKRLPTKDEVEDYRKKLMRGFKLNGDKGNNDLAKWAESASFSEIEDRLIGAGSVYLQREKKSKELIEEREVQKLGKIKLKEGDKLKFVGGEELTQMSKHNRGGIVSVNSSKLKVSQDTIFKFVQKKDWSYSGGKLSGLLEFEYVSGPNENGVDSVVISMDGTNQFKDVKVLNN